MDEKYDRIPPWAVWLLNRVLPQREIPNVNGSFEDLYAEKGRSSGRLKAYMWIWSEILKSLPGFIYATFYWRVMMVKNYVLMAFRNIRKHAVYSGINIIGLALGMTVCLLIFLWVQNEFRYDRFHARGADIAQVYSELEYSDGSLQQVFTGSYYPLARVLRSECSEVLEAARFQTVSEILISHGDKHFRNHTAALVDAPFFDIFTFPFIEGNPDAALDDNNSIVLTEHMAEKYFGTEDPMGKILTINGNLDLQVTGLIRDVPSRSSLQFDCVAPFVLAFAPEYQEPEHWGGNPLRTYVLLNENSNQGQVGQKITAAALRHMNPETVEVTFSLFPLKRWHLYSPQGGGLIHSVLIFSVIAFFVLLIACINFTNLSTARAATRAKEVGLRKVVGARRTDLFWQFIGETLMISVFTLVMAVGLLALLLPVFNHLLNKDLTLSSLLDPVVFIGFLGTALLTGILAGFYPALYLSSFQPGRILRGLLRTGSSSALRKVLVLCQFSLSIILMICTLVVIKQLDFMMHTDLGFDRENLVVLQMSDIAAEQYVPMKTELLRNSDIRAVTRSMQGPWNIGSTVSAVDWDGKPPDENLNLFWDYVGYDYFETLGMEMAQGRSFSRDFPTDRDGAYIVNQEAVKLMGMDSPLGKRLSVFRKEGKIIGVVKNFHFQPLYHEIKPFVFMLRPDSGSLAFVRIQPENISGSLGHISGTLSKFDPIDTTAPLFFNDILKNYIYTAEQQSGRVGGYLALLAVVISSMGLFGLAAFMAERRTKEIGIRKVVGASAAEVVGLLSRDFSKWVLISNVIAWPVAYFAAHRMLERYAFRVGISPDVFVLPGLAAFVIAFGAVSFQTIKAARANPADSLRCE